MFEPLFQVLLTPSRVRFRWRNRKRPAVTENLVTVLRERLAEVGRANWPAYQTVYNVGLFAALIDQDIWACSEAVVFARSDWHRRFHAKHLAVLLVEAAEDLTELLAKDYDASLLSLGLGEPWLVGRRDIHKKISAFRNRNDAVLGEIRNHVGAHREHQAVEQWRVQSEIDPLQIVGMATELAVPVGELLVFSRRLVTYMHDPAVTIMHGMKMVSQAQQSSGLGTDSTKGPARRRGRRRR